MIVLSLLISLCDDVISLVSRVLSLSFQLRFPPFLNVWFSHKINFIWLHTQQVVIPTYLFSAVQINPEKVQPSTQPEGLITITDNSYQN